VIKVLVVDDSALARKLFTNVLAAEPDFEVQSARDGIEALALVHSFRPDVVTLDVHMPKMDGLACLDRIIIERPCPVVMVSSLTAEGADATLEALRLGAVDFVAKPEGVVSLGMDAFAPRLVEKVRAAAAARLRPSLRLKERVLHRTARSASRGDARSASHGDARSASPPRGIPESSARGPASGNGLVLVGVSTGGPSALEALLTPLSEGFAWPILIAQHMPASFTGALAKRLDDLCALHVVEVRRPTPLQPGHAYIGRGEADLIVGRRASGLVAMAAPERASYPWHPSTDRLVRSAMEHLPASQLIGVLMTGMGDDGAEAMTELLQRGGRTIAQSEDTAVVWGMPGELVRAGGAEWVEPLERIADRLMEITPPHAAHS
jgi:two-component system, chemotaxis family, protein-glutamate methylesterase/glutaminase